MKNWGQPSHHGGFSGSVAERKELVKHTTDAWVSSGQSSQKRYSGSRVPPRLTVDVGLDVIVGEHLSAGVLPSRITYLRCASAQEDNGLVARLLEVSEDHDLQEGAHVQRGGGGVKAKVGGHDALRHLLVQLLDVGA